MTLHPQNYWEVPKETVRVARASFPKGNVYMKMYDELGTLYKDKDFVDLFPIRCGQSAISPARLALITIMQFAEGLTDRQAADAVRSRIDWKYALGLNLTDSGFDATVLSEFRGRLCQNEASNKLLDVMVSHFKEHKLIKSRGKQRTDSTQVVAAIRQVNRLELVGETLRATLNQIATLAPEWLQEIISEDWFDRYSERFENYRLPKEKTKREEMALLIGRDGHHLLEKLWREDDTQAEKLRQIESVDTLRRVWIQQYVFIEGRLLWRNKEKTGLPPHSISIESPYDTEARNGKKREKSWTGYKVHLTETCDPDTPNIITNVETTVATTPDGVMTSLIHHKLAEKDGLPREHYVDAAYVDAYQLVESHQVHQVELVGPVAVDVSWQSKLNTGFDVSAFFIDWDKKIAQCPQGRLSRSWRIEYDKSKHPVIQVGFDRQHCTICPARTRCTKSKKAPRKLKLRPRDEYESLNLRRQEQKTKEFKKKYGCRAGIEGTISQGVRKLDLRRTRYSGLAKTHLQHIAIACAMNLSRFFSQSNGLLKAQTRTSSFARLRRQYA
jgi:transposase